MERISAVYQIINTVTGDRYVGSSRDVFHRWAEHKRPSTWKNKPNKRLYQDMQKYGLENFRFQILAPVMEEYLRQVEQEFIEMLKPIYNKNNAKGWDVEKCKAVQKKRQQSEKRKTWQKKRDNHPCEYNGKTLTFGALKTHFQRAGIPHATLEAKKYIIKGEQ